VQARKPESERERERARARACGRDRVVYTYLRCGNIGSRSNSRWTVEVVALILWHEFNSSDSTRCSRSGRQRSVITAVVAIAICATNASLEVLIRAATLAVRRCIMVVVVVLVLQCVWWRVECWRWLVLQSVVVAEQAALAALLQTPPIVRHSGGGDGGGGGGRSSSLW